MIRNKINVAKGFQTSVNVAYDLNNENKIRSFIPTQSSIDVIEDVLLSTATNATQRSRILIGAYGRGKSHIVLVLLALLSGKDKSLFDTLLIKMKENNPALHKHAVDYLESNKRLLPVVIRGSSSSLSSSFLNALQLALNDEGLANIMPETHFQAAINAIANWKADYPQTYKRFVSMLTLPIDDFVAALKTYDEKAYESFLELYPELTSGSIFNPYLGFDIVELYESVAISVKSKGYDGIYVVYDEFSKYLESSIANATISDIKLLQDFAEKCDRSGQNQMHLLLISHKDISNYIDEGLPKEKVDGWRGISGRFKHINLHNNYAQMYEIISAVIEKKPEFWKTFTSDNQERFDELICRFVGNKLLDGNNQAEIINAIYECYPLHPISTFILPRLSERVAQNERTLFTFLSSDDKYTLSAFLNSADGDFPLLTPDYLYDYFESLLRKEPYTSEAHKLYKLTTSVLQKVNEKSLESKIIKTIALMYLVEQFEKLPPIVDMVIDAYRDSVNDVKIINEALTELIEKECIVYLKRSNNYLKIKESSGVDIPHEIAWFIDKNRANMRVKDILNRSVFDSYMYPTRYNDDFEITRYFEFAFINSDDFWDVRDWEARISSVDADGIIYAIIPQDAADIKKLVKALHADTFDTRIIFIVPKNYRTIDAIALEYEAVTHLRAEASGDDLLVDEYDIYLDDLTEVMGYYIHSYSHPEIGEALYFHGGQQRPLTRKAHLTELLSTICETVYNRTPVINNESINKKELSTVAINSRTKLLTGLLAIELAPNLGLFGTGQDVSIMRSTLVKTGILLNAGENPTINLEPEDVHMKNMLAVVSRFFSSAVDSNGTSFASLYKELTHPQYGIGLRQGVIPIFIAAVLKGNKQRIVVKYNDNEVKVTPDLLNDINETPEDYSVILEDWSAEKARYISELEDIFKDHITEREKAYNGFSYILFAMNRWYMNLPKYAKETEKTYIGNGEFIAIDTHSKRFINSLKQLDNNPREYLLSKLFSIFAMNFSAHNTEILEMIRTIKSDWDNLVPALINIITVDIKDIFAASRTNGSLSSIIKDWYETLSENTLQYLFSGNENRVLNLMSTITNEDILFVQRLSKAITGLRIEDWNAETILTFRHDLKVFKDTVDEYNLHGSATNTGAEMYKIIFTNESGYETTKTFSKTVYSKRAKLLFNDLTNSIEEMGQSISEQEKRQVLIELLERLC